MIAAPREAVMAVIADFAAYPQWASAVRATEVLGEAAAGRASKVRFTLDAGVVKDTYVLGYDWDGDAGVHWHLAEPGSVISAMDGGYVLAEGRADLVGEFPAHPARAGTKQPPLEVADQVAGPT